MQIDHYKLTSKVRNFFYVSRFKIILNDLGKITTICYCISVYSHLDALPADIFSHFNKLKFCKHGLNITHLMCDITSFITLPF